ncbi:3'3'-cGAMP-specific phosphodiesterase 2 [Candidatus Magnetomoraceae bacterium gMMP-15]
MSDKSNEIIFHKDDDLVFADEKSSENSCKIKDIWKIMIIDDEIEVHTVTKMVLEEFIFEGQGIKFLSAYSGNEGKDLIQKHSDTAVILLDVVMETEDSGLNLIKYIRNVLKNKLVRIILRTGHPGQAPERKVITEYDINDYKEKTELTAQKLFTTVTSALRGYRDLKIIDKNRKGLEQIIESSASLFRLKSLKQFAAGVLTQLISILGLDDSSVYLMSSGFAATNKEGNYHIIAATGKYSEDVDISDIIPESIIKELSQISIENKCFFIKNTYIGYFKSKDGLKNILYLKSYHTLSELDKNLMRIFSTNVAIAFDNISLNKEIVDTEKEVIFTLGEVVENRSKETANHVRRVAEYSRFIAIKLGFNEKRADILRLASPMHDVGKIGIPDSILNKPGPLTLEEFEIIKNHTIIGYEILKNSKRAVMKAASIIAIQHHERWNGSGYPYGLKGENIHIFSLITGLADVFDALSQKRVYKEAWDMVDIINLIKNERGQHFDPKIVDLFLDNIDEFIAIKEQYPDDRN